MLRRFPKEANLTKSVRERFQSLNVLATSMLLQRELPKFERKHPLAGNAYRREEKVQPQTRNEIT